MARERATSIKIVFETAFENFDVKKVQSGGSGQEDFDVKRSHQPNQVRPGPVSEIAGDEDFDVKKPISTKDRQRGATIKPRVFVFLRSFNQQVHRGASAGNRRKATVR